MDERIYIMGVGDDGYEGLSRHAQGLLNEAGLILGPPGLIDRLKMVTQPKEIAPAPISQVGGIKGRRMSKKDKLREAAARGSSGGRSEP